MDLENTLLFISLWFYFVLFLAFAVIAFVPFVVRVVLVDKPWVWDIKKVIFHPSPPSLSLHLLPLLSVNYFL
jgi:hypothetical protein